MKNIIKRGGHGSSSSSSANPNSSPNPNPGSESAVDDAKDSEEGRSGDGEDETGYDGVKESEGGKDGGKKKEKEEGHIGRHGSFSHGGAGLPGRMLERILKK